MTQTLSSAPKSSAPPAEPQNCFFRQLWPAVAMTLIIAGLCGILYPLLVWGIAQLAFPHQANGSLVDKNGQPTTDDAAAVGSALLGQSFGDAKYFHPRPSNAGSGYDASNSGATNYGPLSDELLNGLLTPPPATTLAAGTQATTQTAPSQPALPTLTFDGLRLRTLHYARDNNISFKLYLLHSDGSKDPVALERFLDKNGNLTDLTLVDAFPHAGDPDTKTPLIAADFSTPVPADAVTASASGLDPHISPANAQLQAHRVAQARKMTDADIAPYITQYTDQRSLGVLGDPGVNVLLLNLALDRDHPVAPPAPTSAPATSPHP